VRWGRAELEEGAGQLREQRRLEGQLEQKLELQRARPSDALSTRYRAEHRERTAELTREHRANEAWVLEEQGQLLALRRTAEQRALALRRAEEGTVELQGREVALAELAQQTRRRAEVGAEESAHAARLAVRQAEALAARCEQREQGQARQLREGQVQNAERSASLLLQQRRVAWEEERVEQARGTVDEREELLRGEWAALQEAQRTWQLSEAERSQESQGLQAEALALQAEAQRQQELQAEAEQQGQAWAQGQAQVEERAQRGLQRREEELHARWEDLRQAQEVKRREDEQVRRREEEQLLLLRREQERLAQAAAGLEERRVTEERLWEEREQEELAHAAARLEERHVTEGRLREERALLQRQLREAEQQQRRAEALQLDLEARQRAREASWAAEASAAEAQRATEAARAEEARRAEEAWRSEEVVLRAEYRAWQEAAQAPRGPGVEVPGEALAERPRLRVRSASPPTRAETAATTWREASPPGGGGRGARPAGSENAHLAKKQLGMSRTGNFKQGL